jgi:hypothetical protein
LRQVKLPVSKNAMLLNNAAAVAVPMRLSLPENLIPRTCARAAGAAVARIASRNVQTAAISATRVYASFCLIFNQAPAISENFALNPINLDEC